MKKIYVEMVADLFHYGHVEFLRNARALGDHLTVGVLSDEWTKKYKREPILTWEERARVVEACRYVDAVLLQADPAPNHWILDNGFTRAIAMKDDTDKARHFENSVGFDRAREVELPYEYSISTTDIIQRINRREKAHQQNITLIRQLFAPRWEGSEWLLAQQMLQDIGHILDANAMPWFLAFGTHLGAVRHQGIIPWDDDIDIAIRGEDEQKLLALAPDLKKVGYNIRQCKSLFPPYKQVYYKIWIDSIPSTTGFEHSWPFVDIFVLRPSDTDPGQYGLDDRTFSASHIFPLKQSKFGSLTLPVPNNPDLLGILYAPDYMTTCISTNVIHRHESICDNITARPAVQVKEAGCFVPVHEMAEMIRQSVPARADGWSLQMEGAFTYLARGGVQLQIDHLQAALWDMLDGKQSVGDIFNLFTGPPIDVMGKVLEGLSLFIKQNAIRFTGAITASSAVASAQPIGRSIKSLLLENQNGGA